MRCCSLRRSLVQVRSDARAFRSNKQSPAEAGTAPKREVPEEKWRRRPDLNRGWRFCRPYRVAFGSAWLRLLVLDDARFSLLFGRSCSEVAPKAYRCHSSHAGTRLAPGELESFSANPLLQHHRLRTAPAGKRPDRLFDSDSRRRHHPVCLRHNDAKRLPGRGRTCTRS